MTSVGVMTADKVTGPYTFASKCFKPDGHASYGVLASDCAAYECVASYLLTHLILF